MLLAADQYILTGLFIFFFLFNNLFFIFWQVFKIVNDLVNYCLNYKFILVVYDLLSVGFGLSLVNDCFWGDYGLGFSFFFTKALFFLRVFHSSCLQEKLLQFAGTHWTSYNCHMLLAKKVKSEKCKVKKQSLELSHKTRWKIRVTCFCCAMWRNFVAGSRNSIKLFVQLEKSKLKLHGGYFV